MSKMEQVNELTDSELLDIGKDGNISNVMRYFAIKSDPRIRKAIAERFEKLGIERNKYKRHDYTINDIKQAVSESLCMIDVVKKLGLSPHGTNTQRIKNIIMDNNIDISTFNIPLAQRRGKRVWNREDIFCERSEYHRSMLRTAVDRFDIIDEYKCSKCGIVDWNGEPLTIELDHINGINNDNRPFNLRWLCPNCHSQTPTHKNGKQI